MLDIEPIISAGCYSLPRRKNVRAAGLNAWQSKAIKKRETELTFGIPESAYIWSSSGSEPRGVVKVSVEVSTGKSQGMIIGYERYHI